MSEQEQAFYTMHLKVEDRPNLRNLHEVYGVFGGDGDLIAYCLSSKQAEHIKALLVYFDDQLVRRVLQEPRQ